MYKNRFFTSDRRTGSGDVLASSLSWNLSKDSALIAMTGTKEITTVADLVCKVASDRGIMEVRVVDHTLEPMQNGQIKIYYMHSIWMLPLPFLSFGGFDLKALT